MTINNGEPPDVSIANLARAIGSQNLNAPNNVPASNAPASPIPTVLDDRIALSMASRLVQQSSIESDSAQLTRILELKTAIEKGQYGVDPLIVSHALIEAELQGR